MLHGTIVTLRPMERSDIPRLWEFAQDMELGLVTGSGGRPTPLASIERMYEERWADPGSDAIRWGIEAHGLLIGGVEVEHIDWRNRSAELAVWIGDRAYRRHGCGSDAMRLALNYCFKLLGLNRLGHTMAESNEPAVGCYDKVGFVEEGRIRQGLFRDNAYHDILLLGILREDWTDDSPLQTLDGPVSEAPE